MKCQYCGDVYDEEMFPVCPFCLGENDMNEKKVEKSIGSCNENDESVITQTIQSVNDDFCQKGENTEVEEIATPNQNGNYESANNIPNIHIEEIDELSRRVKNTLQRDGVFSLQDLIGLVSNNRIDNVTGLGVLGKKEILEYISSIRSGIIAPSVAVEKRVEDVYCENKYNLFVKHCSEHNIKYMSDLDGFDFASLLYVQGIGKGKVNDIIRLYEMYDSGAMERSSVSIPAAAIEKLPVSKHLFTFINEQLKDLDVTILVGIGIATQTLSKLRDHGLNKVGDLENITSKRLESIVGKRNIDKFEQIENVLKRPLLDVFEDVLTSCSNDDDYKTVIKRANGFTLQQIGDEEGKSRERVRQKAHTFNRKISSYMNGLVSVLLYPKNYFSVQELLDIYDNDDFDKIVLYWCKNSDTIDYLDFADVFIPHEDTHETIDKLYDFATRFIGDGINIYDNLEELELTLEREGYPYVDGVSFMNFVKKYGYTIYGDYVIKGKKSYGYLCAKVIEKHFPKGIRISDSKELNRLRQLVYEQYGDIGVSSDDRSLGLRITDYLVLSGRGTYTAESNVHIDMSVLEDIKEYIDDAPEGEIYYSELFSRFEGVLRMMSNVDNYNFLHGVLKLYFADEYDFSNRDSIKKIGEGYKSGKLGDRIREFIEQVKRPVSKNDIKKHIPGLTDIVLINAALYDSNVFLWDYNYYFSTSMLDINQIDTDYICKKIDSIMIETDGYCSDNLLFDAVMEERPLILEKNCIENSNNLFFLCQKILSDRYDFRRPHIGKKGLFDQMSVKKIALHLLGYPRELSYKEYQRVANRLKWPSVTILNEFTEIEKDYIRVSDDVYVDKESFEIKDDTLMHIENYIRSRMQRGYVSLINFDAWDEMPDVGYEWNVFLLRSILDSYIKNLSVVEIRAKDRRFERGIAVSRDSGISNYDELVVHVLRDMGYSELSENYMLTLLVVNNLTYKIIPKDLYTSDLICYDDGVFYFDQKSEIVG